jgi:hypothetical protein
MSTPPEDAQRDLEQHALRNVRSLVDKVEGLDADEKRRERRLLVGLFVAAVAAAAAFAGYLAVRSDTGGKTITIESKKP